jgi:N-acetylneuraminic acid mutarotase
MFARNIRPLTLALTGLTLISCSDETTAPDISDDQVPVENSTADAATASALATAAANSWVKRADMPGTERRDPATAVVRNGAGQSILYAIGGTTVNGASMSTVQAYNVATNSWTYRTSMPTPLYKSNGAGVINGKIYISGGLMRYKVYSDALYIYDPATNRWSPKQPMPATTYGGATGVINNQLYVLTSCDQEDCSEHVRRAFYRYDPATDRWTSLPIPPMTVGKSIAGTIGKKFYATGGNDQVGVYDPVTNAWTIRSASGEVPANARGLAVQGKLFALNIDDWNADGTVSTTIRVYDPATNAWTSRAPVNLKHIGRLAQVVRDGSARIEMVGGPRPGNNLQYTP